MTRSNKFPPFCQHAECPYQSRKFGYCARHYHTAFPNDASSLCSFESCLYLPSSRGLCSGHLRQQKDGEALRVSAALLAPTEIVHGKSSTYSNQRCRCQPCKDAWNKYCREYKAAIVSPLPQAKREQRNRVSNELARIRRNFDYASQLERQGNKCAVCAVEGKRLVTDHIHGTSHVRGLLCISCNTGLGKLGDSVESLSRALDYLIVNTP